MKCSRCPCFDEAQALQSEDGDPGRVGICRRFPPVFVGIDEDNNGIFAQPSVTSEHGCIEGDIACLKLKKS